MTSLKSLVVAVVLLVLAAARCASAVEFEQKWVYLSSNLRTAEGVDRAIALLDRAAESGCTHALMTDSSHLVASTMPPSYFDGVARVKEKAASLKITLVPTIFPTGYGGRYFGFDRNLAAGLPARNVPFIVSGAVATPDPSAVPPLANGAFEEFENDAFKGWSGSDAEGATLSVDTETAHGGKSSVKIVRAQPTDTPEAGGEGGRAGRGGAALSQTLAVEPFKVYRLSFWMKSEGADGAAGRPTVAVTSNDGKRRHVFPRFEAPETADWTRYSLIFNTLDAAELRLSIGASAPQGGVSWLDDVEITPLGLVNVLRRANTPVKVTSADGAVVYEEERDFERVVDPQLSPGNEDHEAPPLRLAAGSRISDGSTVLVSWYHPMRIYADQVNLTISDPAVFEMMDREMKAASQVWGATGYFMNVDEIRLAGWEEGPDGPDAAPSQLLANYTRKAVAIVRKYAPGAAMYTWSDMYTPFHNARPLVKGAAYYLVNGSWGEFEQFLPDEATVEGRWEGPVTKVVQGGSWEGLPSEVVIMNWYARAPEAMMWFADRGHKQIICGYYDATSAERMQRNINGWMTTSKDVPNVIGMMYTTWQNNYDNMAEFFKLVETWPAWATDQAGPGGQEE